MAAEKLEHALHVYAHRHGAGWHSFYHKKAGKPFSLKYAICSLLGAVLVAAIALLDDRLTGSNPWEYNYLTAALAGGIIAIGIVIPGISTSFILMFMGLYEPLLSSLTRLEIPYLICAGCSALIVGALLVVFVRNMFRRHPAGANYCVLGFLIGTTALIFPGFAPFSRSCCISCWPQ